MGKATMIFIFQSTKKNLRFLDTLLLEKHQNKIELQKE